MHVTSQRIASYPWLLSVTTFCFEVPDFLTSRYFIFSGASQLVMVYFEYSKL